MTERYQGALTFADCVAAAAGEPELVEEWDRLTGYRLRAIGRRSPIERMVDDATGFEDSRMREIARSFVAFVFRFVWLPLAQPGGGA